MSEINLCSSISDPTNVAGFDTVIFEEQYNENEITNEMYPVSHSNVEEITPWSYIEMSEHDYMPCTSGNSLLMSEASLDSTKPDKQRPFTATEHFAVEKGNVCRMVNVPTLNDGQETSTKKNSRKKATIVQCKYCGVMTKHPSKIQAHLRTHTGEKPFECLICGMRFTQRTPMRMHVRRHLRETPFVCSFGCGKSYVSNALKNAHELKIHLKEQKPKTMIARTQLRFPRTGFFNTGGTDVPLVPLHNLDAQVLHRPPSAYSCSGSALEANRKLDEVINAVAAGIPLEPPKKIRRRSAIIAECQECGLILKHPSKIKAHMRVHTGERPYQCEFCCMRFSTANPLRVHLRRVHTGEKPFECTWKCGRRFVSISARNEHERVVHAGMKRYQCTIGDCCRLFTRRHYLRLHQKKDHNIDDVVNSFSQNFASFGYKRLNLNNKSLIPSFTVGLPHSDRVIHDFVDEEVGTTHTNLDGGQFFTVEDPDVFEEMSSDNIGLVTKVDSDKAFIWIGAKKMEALVDLKDVQFDVVTGDWLEIGVLDGNRISQCRQLSGPVIEPETELQVTKTEVLQNVITEKDVVSDHYDESVQLEEVLNSRELLPVRYKASNSSVDDDATEEVIVFDELSAEFSAGDAFIFAEGGSKQPKTMNIESLT